MKTFSKMLLVGVVSLGSMGGWALARDHWHGGGGWHGGGWHGGGFHHSRIIIAPTLPPVYSYSPYYYPNYSYYDYPYYPYSNSVIIVRGGHHHHHHHH